MSKPVSPIWTPGGVGTVGCQAYWLLGNDLTDLSPHARHGTMVGSPTWGTGPLGAQLGGFSAANYVRADAAFAWGTYPCAIAVLASTASVTQYQCPLYLGRSGNSPRIEIQWNGGSAGALEGYLANDSGAGPILSASIGTTLYGGQPHVVQLESLSADSHRLSFDGSVVATSSTSISGPFTTTWASIGARLRVIANTPHSGPVIAAGVWIGAVPDPAALAADWLSGTFSAASGTAIPYRPLTLGPLSGSLSPLGR